MPIQVYRCEGQTCGIEFEALILSRLHLEQVSCPKCNGKDLAWVPSTFTSQMKTPQLGSYRGACSNPYENLTLQHVRDEAGKPVTVNSLKELREAEKKYQFVHAVSSNDNVDEAPQHEKWAGDIRHDYKWKWTPPEMRDDFSGVSVGAVNGAGETLVNKPNSTKEVGT